MILVFGFIFYSFPTSAETPIEISEETIGNIIYELSRGRVDRLKLEKLNSVKELHALYKDEFWKFIHNLIGTLFLK